MCPASPLSVSSPGVWLRHRIVAALAAGLPLGWAYGLFVGLPLLPHPRIGEVVALALEVAVVAGLLGCVNALAAYAWFAIRRARGCSPTPSPAWAAWVARAMAWLCVEAAMAVLVWFTFLVPYIPGGAGVGLTATRVWLWAGGFALLGGLAEALGRLAQRRPFRTAMAVYGVTVLTLLAAAVPIADAGANGGTSSPTTFGALPANRRPTGVRVLVIGVDGGTWTILRPLIDSGKMPHLAALCERGVSGVLRSIPPFYSPSLWPSIDTGAPPEVHGMHSYCHLLLPGVGSLPTEPITLRPALFPFGIAAALAVELRLAELTPARSDSTRLPRLWDRVDAAGGSTVVCGWPGTWPAPNIRGVMVSDRWLDCCLWLLFRAPPAAAGMISPTEADAWLAPHHRRPDQFVAADFARFFPVDAQSQPWLKRTDFGSSSHDLTIFKTMHNIDRSIADCAVAALDRTRPDLALVLFESPDFVAHAFWNFHFQRTGPETPPDLLQRYAGTLTAYYQWLDDQIGRLSGEFGPNDVVAVISDHGMAASDKGYHFKADHSRDGVYVLAGGPVRNAAAGPDLDLLQVTPLFAWLLGLAPAPEFRGTAPTEVLDDEFRAAFPWTEPTRAR